MHGPAGGLTATGIRDYLPSSGRNLRLSWSVGVHISASPLGDATFLAMAEHPLCNPSQK